MQQMGPQFGEDRLNTSERTRIASYLDAGTSTPEHADLIFVPGTRLPTPARIAAQLMAQGVASLVVVTGGVNQITHTNEATALRAELLTCGVEPEQIIVEDTSANTLENVVRAWPLVVDRIGAQPLNRVLAVCKWMHSRRVLMTLRAQFPPGIHYYAHTYAPEGISREAWCRGQAPTSRTANVLSNWASIPTYLARGDIAEVVPGGDGSWV